jgi:integrase/recombinase XerD
MAGDIPFSQAADEYLDWLLLDTNKAPRTVAEYKADLCRFATFAFDGADDDEPGVSAIDRELLRSYQRHLARIETGPKGNRRPLAPATRARRLIALRGFLRFAAREEWLPGDLGTMIDLPKLPERLPKPLDDNAREALLEDLPSKTPPQKRDRAFIFFLLSTGARIDEALRLDRPQWNPTRMKVIGKGDKERPVNVTEKARAAVEDYLASRTDPSPALFIGFQPAKKNAVDNRLTVQGARHICHQLALLLGIPRFHPHQLRHTLGTLLQETMGDARLTAETLGHKGLGSVSGYTKITDARRREAYEQMQKRGL